MLLMSIARLITIVALSLSCIAQADEPAKQAEKPVNILQIVGEKHHDYESQKVIIQKGIGERIESTWETHHHKTKEAAKEFLDNPDFAKGFDLVIYNMCHARETDVEFIKRLCKVHHDQGIPVIGLHCTMHSYHIMIPGDPLEKEWNKLLGVHSHGHGRHIPITITKSEVEHPVTKDMPKVWKTTEGELYFVKKVLDGTTVLATGVNGDADAGTQPVAWVNQYGKARVFCTTLGHHNSTVQNPIYLDMVANGVRWALGKGGDNKQE
jgi:type 1 glutamine amidotransferase